MSCPRRALLPLLTAAALIPSSALARPGVVVPRPGPGLFGAYARLHAAGLKVSLPAFLIRGQDLRAVVAVRPRPGTRVTAGTAVHVVLGPAAPRPQRRARSAWVPEFVGSRASAAETWALRHHVHLTLRLGRLTAGGAPSLLENYEIARQSPAVGRTRTLTVWAVQAVPLRYGRCRFPWNGTFVARDGQAAVVLVGTTQTGVWYGCVAAVGVVRTLGTSASDEYNGGTGVGNVTLTAATVGFDLARFGGKYDPSCADTVTVITLTSGKRVTPFTGNCGSIDSLVVNAAGFAAWRTTTSATFTAFNDVACPTVALCVAVDTAGNVATTTDPTGGHSAWTLSSLGGGLAMNGVACAAVTLCVGVGGARVATSTNPTGGASAWSVGQLPGPAPSPTGLFDVACPSNNLCVAVGTTIATSTNPAAGAGSWTTSTLPGNHDLFGLSCPSVSLCEAVDAIGGGLYLSTNPTGGASAWTATKVPGADTFLTGISCPSTSLCVASDADGQILTSTNPAGGSGAWTVTDTTGGFLTRISCPTTSMCVAGSLNGIAWSTDPTGGVGAWSHAALAGAFGFVGIACPSATLCVAASNNGRMATATAPTSGPSAWTTALVDGPPCVVNTPCISEQLMAYDDSGTHVLDGAGAGSGAAIANLRLSGDQLTWTHDGAPHSATLS